MSVSKNRKKTVTLAVRIDQEEHAIIKEKARDSGVTVSELFRCSALGRKTRSTLDSQIINQLSKIGGLQKHLFNESGGGNSKAYAEILKELKAAIIRIAERGE